MYFELTFYITMVDAEKVDARNRFWFELCNPYIV